MNGFKGFDKDMKCRGMQFEVGQAYEVPEADWRRLVELVKWAFPGCECEGLCDACREDREIKAIIQRTEEANDA